MRVVLFLSICAAVLRAQDPFEIHVYEYEPLPPRTFTYEAHMNYIAKGLRRLSLCLGANRRRDR